LLYNACKQEWQNPKIIPNRPGAIAANHLNEFHPKFAFLTGDNLAEELHEYAREHNLDLLIVVPKNRGF